MKKKKYYDVSDVKRAGFTLEPLRCRKCGKIGEVVFNQKIGDASCQLCGAWQEEYNKSGKKNKLKKMS